MVSKEVYVVGDIVVLRSGGPNMTVNEVITESYKGKDGLCKESYFCQWFVNSRLECGLFSQESLLNMSL